MKSYRGLSLTVPKGEVHAIMGPNGSGKSTLAKVMAGHEEYQVSSGEVLLDGQKPARAWMWMNAHAPACFLPFSIRRRFPGVSNANFLRAARQARLPEGEEIDAVAFLQGDV